MKLLVTALVAAVVMLALSGQAHATPPIVQLDGIQPQATIFEAASRTEPLVVKSKEQAAEQFDRQTVAKLREVVDFDEQFVLVFAWRGSGQDKLDYEVAESFPEQITFNYTPGRTRDLRPHVYIFALRNNVTWRMGR
ncbi:MAG: hypothetical protein WD030_09085 [Pirellulales bacterium]